MQKAFKNIRRSPYQAFASMAIVSLTLFVVGIFSLVMLGSQQILLNFETKPQIIGYLKDGHSQSQVQTLISELNDTPGVKKAVYISKQDALELYKKSVNNDPMLLGTITDWGIVTADILPASVEVTATNPEAFDRIVAVLQKNDLISTNPQGNKEIDLPQDVVTELTKWTKAIRVSGVILVIALSFVSVLTIMIVISMKISSRRSEISTMKLLGARNSYIISPYLQESIVYGVVGSVFGWLFVYIAMLYSTPFLSTRLAGIIDLPVSPVTMFILLGCMVGFGIILSFISGFFAAIRFIKRAK